MTAPALAIGTHDDLPAVRPLIPGPCILAQSIAITRSGTKLDGILDDNSQVVVLIEQPDPSDSQEAFERYGQRCSALLNAINSIATE